MSKHSMILRCKDCEEKTKDIPFDFGWSAEFCMDMEYFNRESLIEEANRTECPKCHSRNWYMTDGCER